MGTLEQQLKDIIGKRVREEFARRVQLLVRKEMVKVLRKYGITSRMLPRERPNSSLSLIDVRDPRRRAGYLSMERIKGDILDQMRFKLNGLKARDPRDQINFDDVFAEVWRAIEPKLKVIVKDLFR